MNELNNKLAYNEEAVRKSKKKKTFTLGRNVHVNSDASDEEKELEALLQKATEGMDDVKEYGDEEDSENEEMLFALNDEVGELICVFVTIILSKV